jgi:MFS family permease
VEISSRPVRLGGVWRRARPGPVARDRRARAAASGAYFVQGLCFATVLSQVPALKEKFGFSDDDLTLVLAAVPIVAGVGSLVAGALAPRLGSRAVLRTGGPLVCAAITAVGLVGVRPALYVAVAALGLCLGLVDASVNMQGVAVQARYGRSIISSFHGWLSMGGIAGSLAAAGFNKLDVPLAVALGSVGAFGAVIALSVGPVLLRRTEELAEPGHLATPAPHIPWRPILLIGAAVLAMYIADSATFNWSAIYLHDALHGSKSVAALGVFAYVIFQMLGRTGADRLVRQFGPAITVAVGGLVGGIGMALVVVAPTPLVGLAGFAIVGAGLCVVVPQSFSAAGALDPTGSGVAVARVNLFNYIGFVVGAILIGAVAHGSSLRWAFGVPAVLALVIVALARSFNVARPAMNVAIERESV